MKYVTILGPATRPAASLNKWLKSKGCPEYAALYLAAGAEFGVRGDMALFQSCLETGWFTFPGDAKKEQNNFAGIGTTGGGVPGDSFPDPETGIRAQLQDLALRCDTYLPKESIIAPYAKKHYSTISNRHSKFWEDLTGTWAMDQRYHEKIYAIAAEFDKAFPQEKPMSKPTWINIASGVAQACDSEGFAVESVKSNSVEDLRALLDKHNSTAKTWATGSVKEPAGPVKPDPIDPVKPKKTRFLCEPGHSNSAPGARSNDGSVKEEKLNQFAAKLCQTLLAEAGYTADYIDPDPDNLTAIGKEARKYDVVISFHHNSYTGTGNPYHCVIVDPSVPTEWKKAAGRLAAAIEVGANGTVADTKLFGGTNGIPGVYEAELTVLNTSWADPDGKPPFHVLPEFFFLNPMKDQGACLKALSKIIPEFTKQLMLEFPA